KQVSRLRGARFQAGRKGWPSDSRCSAQRGENSEKLRSRPNDCYKARSTLSMLQREALTLRSIRRFDPENNLPPKSRVTSETTLLTVTHAVGEDADPLIMSSLSDETVRIISPQGSRVETAKKCCIDFFGVIASARLLSRTSLGVVGRRS